MGSYIAIIWIVSLFFNRALPICRSVPPDLPIDPNEPLYCYCQQVSYGEMVACDNDDVSPCFV